MSMAQEKNYRQASGAIAREARFLKETLLDPALLEVFAGERAGTAEERAKLNHSIARLKGRIFTEAVYLLARVYIEDPREARRIFDDIIRHRNAMVRALKRFVSIEVAALDYMQNVRNVLKQPTIIEADQYNEFAYHAILDETTQAYDKHLLDSDIEAEMEKARRFGTGFSVLFIDLDNLKQINDQWGHEAGTRAIQHVSSIIRENLRKYDALYRYGGDEFVVLLPRADGRQACETARRVLERVRKVPEELLPSRPGISIGIATYDPDEHRSASDLLAAADNALYEAKREGKNAIRFASKGPSQAAVVTPPTTGDDARMPSPDHNGRKVIQGLPLVSGMGIGTAFHYSDVLSREIETREIKEHELNGEMGRMLAAIERVKQDLDRIRSVLIHDVGRDKAAVFDVHRTILEDTDLLARLDSELRGKRVNAENVIRSVFRQLETRFRRSGSSVLAERAHDIHDIGRRILRVMTGVEDNPLARIAPDTVIFSCRLLPSDTVHFTKTKPAAIVTEEGGPGGHSALIARSMGIPSVSGVVATPAEITPGAPVIVDADRGRITVNPTPDELREARERISAASKAGESVVARSRRRARRSKSAADVSVYANVSAPDDVRLAMELGCDGIGLYRTENIYMLAPALPGEEQLYDELAAALEPAVGKPIVLRLADFGADKVLPYLNVGREHSSSLGVRGIRFLLRYPEVLEAQLRVFLRLASRYDIRILAPFVTTAGDMTRVREAVERCRAAAAGDAPGGARVPPVGAMLETPLSVAAADAILDTCDFVSIGTNDLQQFVTAADRESLEVAQYYEEGLEVVIRMVADVTALCRRLKKECYVCGEIAGDTENTGRLIEAGLRRFSVLPPLVPAVKERVHDVLKGGRMHRDKDRAHCSYRSRCSDSLSPVFPGE